MSYIHCLLPRFNRAVGIAENVPYVARPGRRRERCRQKSRWPGRWNGVRHTGMTDMESHHPSSYRKPFKADAAAFGTGGAELTDEIDFDAMDERLGGEPAAPAESHVAQTGDSAEMVNMLDWLDGPEARVYFGRSFSLKLLALSWVFNPGKFEGKSLSEVAKERGVTVQCLSKYTSEVSRIYGERNASQKAHGKRWEKQLQRGR